jgi:transcriptional regulator
LENKFIAEVNDLGEACVKDLLPPVKTLMDKIKVFIRANHILSHLQSICTIFKEENYASVKLTFSKLETIVLEKVKEHIEQYKV